MADENETLVYRMDSIESQIKEINAKIDKLTDAIMQSQINNNSTTKDIEQIMHNQDKMQDEISSLKKQVAELQAAPVKKDADKWRYILDYLFKAIVACGVTAFLIRLGLKN